MKKITMKKIAAVAIVAGMAVSMANLVDFASINTQAAGKVAVTPYIQYTFDSMETMFQNSGSSASDNTKDYTLQKYGNAQPKDLCYDTDLELKDNAALYLEGANNPFANGDLTDFTIAIDVKAITYQSWYGAVVSWDGIKGDADAGNHKDHKYMRVNSADNSEDTDWLRFMENQAYEEYQNFAHWNSYGKGAKLYTGDRTVSAIESTITIVISVDKDQKIVAKSFEGVNAKETVVRELEGKNWNIYDQASEGQKYFILGAAYDSRTTEASHWHQKFSGKMDNVRIYDFAMSEAEMVSYGESEERQLFVDGVEIDTQIVGGTVTVDNDRPEIGETVTLTPVPDANSELVKITVNGEEVEPVGGVYQATMVEGGLFVSAEYIRSFGVSVDPEITNGSITVDKTTAKEGETITVTATANQGYKVKQVTANGAPLEEVNGVYTTKMLSEEIVVSAQFAKWLNLSVKDGITGGSVTLNKTQCWEDENVIINVKADEGYEVKKVMVNGVEVQKSGIVYKFTATQDSVVDVTFGKIGEEASTASGGCGSVLVGSGAASLALLGSAFVVFNRKKRK